MKLSQFYRTLQYIGQQITVSVLEWGLIDVYLGSFKFDWEPYKEWGESIQKLPSQFHHSSESMHVEKNEREEKLSIIFNVVKVCL